MRIHPQGWPFIAIFAAINALLLLLSPWAAIVFLPLTVWCVAFFRDPQRTVPAGAGLIVSPADGRLLKPVRATPPPELGLGQEPLQRLSIFMSVFNVHVNRVPADGTVTALAYRPGKFFNASFDKASEHNERMAVRLRLEGSAATPLDVVFVQIAGLVARRIHCRLSKDQHVCRGDRFGIIRFGSRLDVYLPDAARVRVSEGQNVRAGETVLADFPKLMSRMRGPNLRAAVAEGDLQFARFLPSALTLLGLCCGATAIRFALSANWKAAVTAIVLAAIFDVLDGGVARLFGADSEFGAQLDSLADLVSFGIAPAMLVYTWTLHYAGGAGWAMALIFCVCCAIRLARFMIENSHHDEDAPPEPFFVGVPTPAAACLILLPMIVSFQFHDAVFANPVVTMAMIAATSLLMVSRVPTPSLKGIHLTRQTRGPVTAFAGLLLGFAVLWPWSTLTVSLIVYLAGIPAAVAIARDDR